MVVTQKLPKKMLALSEEKCFSCENSVYVAPPTACLQTLVSKLDYASSKITPRSTTGISAFGLMFRY